MSAISQDDNPQWQGTTVKPRDTKLFIRNNYSENSMFFFLKFGIKLLRVNWPPWNENEAYNAVSV